MFKLIFLATRAWKLVPRRHRRKVLFTAAAVTKKHGPKIIAAANRARTARGGAGVKKP